MMIMHTKTRTHFHSNHIKLYYIRNQEKKKGRELILYPLQAQKQQIEIQSAG